MRGVSLYTALLAFLLLGCSGPAQLNVSDAESYFIEHMNQQAVRHTANGYELEVKPMPSQYLALRETKVSGILTQASYDSAHASYGQARYFLLTIKPQHGVRQGDIMMHDVQDYQAYQERFLDLSFQLSDRLTMEFEGGALPPVLTNTEHGYGLTEHRSAMVAFAPSSDAEYQAITNGPVTLVFDDRIFKTGISRFPFAAAADNVFPLVRINKT